MTAYQFAAGQIRQHIEQIESAEAEKQIAADLVKENYAAAKADGLDGKILRKIVAMRKKGRDALAEEEALLAVYREAVGL